MGILTPAMRALIEEQRLGYIATVCPDGTPNLSPRGTIDVWDDDHLYYADIRSPGTTRNLRQNPAIELNVIDPLSRAGYRFKGAAIVLTDGPDFEAGVARFRARGSRSPVRAIVLVTVTRALRVTSPAYDDGTTEEAIRARWEAYWSARRAPSLAPSSD